MQTNRVLGIALIGAALSAGPAMAQQNNGTNTPANNAPAASASNDQTNSTNSATNAGPGKGTDANANTANNGATGTKSAMGTANNGAAGTDNTAPNNTPAGSPGMTPANTAANNPGPANNTTASNNNGPSGTLEKYDNDWRASKVVGATVYNSQGQSLGTVNDLLMSDNGTIDKAVISTGGGVLGIGGKLVAVPFNELKFQPSAGQNGVLRNTEAPATSAQNNNALGNNANNAPVATAANPPNNAAAAPARREEYSVVLPDATKDSLAKQETFKYASANE